MRDNGNLTPAALFTAARQQIWSSAAHTPVAVQGAIRKSADETVNDSNTLQNDDHLVMALGANEEWAIHYVLYFTNASGTPGVSLAFTVPSGCTGWASTLNQVTSGDGILGLFNNVASANTQLFSRNALTAALGIGNGATFAVGLIILDLYVINSSTPGNLQLQWAQAAAVSSNTIMKKGSYMVPTRLA